MIELQDVSLRYPADRGPGEWVLQDVNLLVPPARRVAVLGGRGAGKTSLLKLVSGQLKPTSGSVKSDARLASPGKFLMNLQRSLTGRQNAKFICRVSGETEGLLERLERIEQIARLGGSKFDEPVSAYSAVQRTRLSFALSWVLECDVYVADAFNFAGALAFGDEALAKRELEAMAGQRALLFAPLGGKAEILARELCTAAILVGDGKARWFDDVTQAFAARRGADTEKKPRESEPEEAAPGDRGGVLRSIREARSMLLALEKGLTGERMEIPYARRDALVAMGEHVGLDLNTYDELVDMGNEPDSDAGPVVVLTRAGAEPVELYASRPEAETE